MEQLYNYIIMFGSGHFMLECNGLICCIDIGWWWGSDMSYMERSEILQWIHRYFNAKYISFGDDDDVLYPWDEVLGRYCSYVKKEDLGL